MLTRLSFPATADNQKSSTSVPAKVSPSRTSPTIVPQKSFDEEYDAYYDEEIAGDEEDEEEEEVIIM